jgi:alpha-galactosidase
MDDTNGVHPMDPRLDVSDGVLTVRCGDQVVLRATSPVHVVLDGSPQRPAPDEEPTPQRAIEWSAVPRGTAGGVWECTLTVHNRGVADLLVSRADPLCGVLGAGEWSALHFTSGWGAEFAPVRGDLSTPVRLQGSSGRSSNGRSPWLGLERPGAALVVSPAWSGNWHIDVEPDTDYSRVLSAGISPVDFGTVLAPGASFAAPSVFLAAGGTLDDAAARLAAAVGSDLSPQTPESAALPVEWNHWWPYEDAEIDDEVFRTNAATAAGLGIQVCTLDAGWFGRAAADSDWQHERGDWAHVNTERFPRGLPALASDVRAMGMDFGVWIEAEAVGSGARLRAEQPDIIATRSRPPTGERDYKLETVSLDAADPAFLGYVCLGSPGGRRHVLGAMDALVRETGARWVKLDFNVDPGAGCDRVDHGHGPDDGLLAHYEGLYAVLDEFRAAHPAVLLEACSSGGLRLDLGLARHVHCFFLSDPDWTEHHLQVLWGASLLLPPVAILHWSWSQWRTGNPHQKLDFAALSTAGFDTVLRAAMVHRFGVSLKLPELPAALAERLRVHVDAFRRDIAPLVREGVLRRNTGQPLRHGGGERVPVFQLDAPGAHLVAAFVLPGGRAPAALRWSGLDPAATYRVADPTDPDRDPIVATGAALIADGVALPAGPATSWLLTATAQP